MRSCLQKRPNGNYYFRKRIPQDLITLTNKCEIVKSLKTNDRKKALLLTNQLENIIEKCFVDLQGNKAISFHEFVESIVVSKSGNIHYKVKEQTKTTLDELLDKWCKQTNPTISSVYEWKLTVKGFTELFGSLDIHSITSQHILKYKEVISKLPARYTLKHPDKTILEAFKIYECTEPEGLPSPGTIHKKLAALKSLLSFAKHEGLTTQNAAEGITIKDKNALIRKSFTKEDLQSIFNNSLKQYNNHKFWIPLISLYTGARLEEIGQLRISDIKKIDNIYYFDINAEDGKKLKTLSSVRRIPIHNKLIKSGFLTYLGQIKRDNHIQLFPELKASTDGSLTTSFSKWFARHLDIVGISDKRKVFHSFRHTFKDACREAEIPEDIHDALTGHSNNRSIGRTYGEGHKLATLDRL